MGNDRGRSEEHGTTSTAIRQPVIVRPVDVAHCVREFGPTAWNLLPGLPDCPSAGPPFPTRGGAPVMRPDPAGRQVLALKSPGRSPPGQRVVYRAGVAVQDQGGAR